MSLLCRPHLAHAPPPPEPAATSPQSHRRRHPHYPRLAPSSLMKVSLAQFNILGFPSIFYLLISSSPVNYALVLMSQVFTLTSWWCSILQIWWWRQVRQCLIHVHFRNVAQIASSFARRCDLLDSWGRLGIEGYQLCQIWFAPLREKPIR